MDIGQSNLSVLNTNIGKTELEINVTENKIIKRTSKEIMGIATKRGIDILASIVGIILLLPITLFVAICNLTAGEHGPIFFMQERIGKNGKIFKMYKFRTMIVDAEKVLQRHIEDNTEIGKEYIQNKKIKNDPRITKIGRFLRNTSIDEVPQFMNVLKGEMSLVGPRPYLPREKEEMGQYYQAIVSMKPGLTGPWQTAGRSNLGFEDRLKLDQKYYKEKTLGKDMKMVVKTFTKIIQKEGAM